MSSLNSITLAQAIYKIFEHTDGESIWDDFTNLCYSSSEDSHSWYDNDVKAEFTKYEFSDNSFVIFTQYDNGELDCIYGDFDPEDLN